MNCPTQTALQGRACWPPVGTAGSSCHLFKVSSAAAFWTRSWLSWCSLHLETVRGVLWRPSMQLTRGQVSKQCSSQSATPRVLRFHWSPSEFGSLFYLGLSFPPFFHGYRSQINTLYPKFCLQRIWSATKQRNGVCASICLVWYH